MTSPMCPICEGKKRVPDGIDRYGEMKYRICEDCNGNGIVSIYKLECIAKDLQKEKIELECKIKGDDDKSN